MISSFDIDTAVLETALMKHRFATEGIAVIPSQKEDTVIFWSSIGSTFRLDFYADVKVRNLVLSKDKCNPQVFYSPALLELLKYLGDEVTVSFDFGENALLGFKIEDDEHALVITYT